MQLVASDDHEGLKAAISRQFQGVSRQRCQVHFARTRSSSPKNPSFEAVLVPPKGGPRRPYLLGRVAKRDRKRLADPANPSLESVAHLGGFMYVPRIIESLPDGGG